MANSSWNGGSDNWTLKPSDWSTDAEPGPGDNVTIATGDPQITNNVGTIASLTLSATLELTDGSSLAVSGSANNSGYLDLDLYGGQGGSDLTIDGALTNSNQLDVGPNNNTLSAPDTVSAASINNIGGAIYLWGSPTELAELNITGAATAAFDATAGQLVGSVNLSDDAAIVFATGRSATSPPIAR